MAISHSLELAGPPTSLGAQHGAALGKRFRADCQQFIRSAETIFHTPYERIRADLGIFDRFVPDQYRQEMQALADAASVTYEDILALTTFLDTSAILVAQRPHCINLVAYGPATADGRLLHGRNLDFPAAGFAEKTAAVFIYHPERGPLPAVASVAPRRRVGGNAFLSVAWGGFIGAVTGMNEHGLTVTEISASNQRISPAGIPVMILLRMVLQYASNIEEAIEIIRSSQRTAGFNITLTDWRVPEAVCVEFDAEKVGIRRARKSLLVVSENSLTPKLAKQELWQCGPARHIRAHDLADQHYGRITPEVMIEILRDRWDPIYRRQGKSYNCLCSNETVQSVIFLPQERRALISNRSVPAPDGEYVEYTLPAVSGVVPATRLRHPDLS
jgi:hypothetical protein